MVKKLPDEVLEQFGNMSNIYNFKVKAWTPADYYLEKVKPKLLEAGYALSFGISESKVLLDCCINRSLSIFWS